MSQGQARWLAAFACVLALAAGCSTSAEPKSGADTRTEQERDRGTMRNGGGY